MAKHVDINLSELRKIPYVDLGNLSGRVLITLTFFENEMWKIWFATPNGLISIKGEPVEAYYFARTQEKDSDIYMEFLNFMSQRASWKEVMQYFTGIQYDILNLAASLGKLEIFHHMYHEKNIEVTRFVSTEIEYIFGVCRSIFDLLQEAIATLWKDKITLLDENIPKKQLKKTFSKMVLCNNKLSSVEEIKTRFRVPTELADFYYRKGPFFQVLRDYRNNVVHSGNDFNFIFVTEKGFAVSADTEPFASLDVWNEEHMLKNRLASLRPVIAHVISETLLACEDFAHTIQKIIKFPPEIAPGFKLFIRGYHNHQLIALKEVLENCLWWEERTPA